MVLETSIEMTHTTRKIYNFSFQIERDAQFLRRHNIVDYSLLIGMQKNFPQNNHLNDEAIKSKQCLENVPDKSKFNESRKISSNERRAIWSSLVRLVDESSIDKQIQGEDQMMLEKMRIESRLSNMSALVELLGEASPVNSPSKNSLSTSSKSTTVLKKFLTPKKDSKMLGTVITSSSSTPTDSFQIHHPATTTNSVESLCLGNEDSSEKDVQTPQKSMGKYMTSIFRPRSKIHPESKMRPNGVKLGPLGPSSYLSPHHSNGEDLHEIKEVTESIFSLDNWHQCVGSLEARDNNRRNLPNEVNAIHILDGIDVR